MRTSLGLVEVKGLATAIDVADAMVKTAAVTLQGVEPAKGSGWMTIKVTGDVAAVQAALSAGSAMARKFNALISATTLARPDSKVLDTWVKEKPAPTAPNAPKPAPQAPAPKASTAKTAAAKKAPAQTPDNAPKKAAPFTPASGSDDTPAPRPSEPLPSAAQLAQTTAAVTPQPAAEQKTNTPPAQDTARGKANISSAAPAKADTKQASCNLCNDPACTRKKGEPRSKCLHYVGKPDTVSKPDNSAKPASSTGKKNK